MKIILKNSSLVFQKGLTETVIPLTSGHTYINKGTGTFVSNDNINAGLSDFISIAGVTKFVVDLNYGYQASPYWYYDSNHDPIANSCTVYNGSSEVISSMDANYAGELTDIPNNAAYVRFCTYNPNSSRYAKKYTE